MLEWEPLENLIGLAIAAGVLFLVLRVLPRWIGYGAAATAHTAGKLKRVYKEAANEDSEASIEIKARVRRLPRREGEDE
jgi:hypothetical protein